MSVKDGIEKCEDKCPCGSHLRLHTYTFNASKPSAHTRFYVDCEAHCGRVSKWHDSPDAAIEAFDREYPS